MCNASTIAANIPSSDQMAPHNGNGHHRDAHGRIQDAKASDLTAGKLYQYCLHSAPPAGGWFSVADMLQRFALVLFMFYRFLAFAPLPLCRFALRYNTLWYGRGLGVLLTMLLPILPMLLCVVELAKRLRESLPWAETDWKMQGPGRVFFVRPDSLLASFLWDFYLCVSVFCGSFLQYGTSEDGILHTWYDSVCTKEYWCGLLDGVGARRPLQLARWDGATVHDVSPGLSHGQCTIVCKISDSYLGIGDKILTRGKATGGDFDTLADVQALLAADPEYSGRPAILSELVQPTEALRLSSEGFGHVHSLDIVTLRTSAGVKVLTVLLWTDCDGWSSHSCQAGYLVDVDTETVVAPTGWYSPYFAKQTSTLIGTHLPGVRAACEKAVAAHAASSLEWLTSVGWDAMITPDGVYFFEGNVAAHRTPRRMFLTPALTLEFLRDQGR